MRGKFPKEKGKSEAGKIRDKQRRTVEQYVTARTAVLSQGKGREKASVFSLGGTGTRCIVTERGEKAFY